MKLRYIFTAAASAGIIALSIFAPAAISKLGDQTILDIPQLSPDDTGSSGYHYNLSNNQKINLLSRGRSTNSSVSTSFQAKPGAGLLSYEQALERSLQEAAVLTEHKILPQLSLDKNTDHYLSFYTAVDVSAPSVNASFWQIEFETDGQFIQFTLDAQTGTILEFAITGNSTVYSVESTDLVPGLWGEYLGLNDPFRSASDDEISYLDYPSESGRAPYMFYIKDSMYMMSIYGFG